MGTRMKQAKKNQNNRIFYIRELSKKDNGNLKCSCCFTDIEYVSAHTRISSKKPVSAYLKLRKGAIHEKSCIYLVKNKITQIVNDSKAIENIKPIFKQNNDIYLFRMNLLIESFEVSKKLKNIELICEQEIKKIFAERNYVKSEEILASYFHSAIGIAKLRASIEESSDIEELKENLRIEYKDQYISWNSFYYDDDRYNILFNQVERNKIKFPVALNITVNKRKNYNSQYKEFQCFSQIIPKNKERIIYVPNIKIIDSSLIEQIKINTNYLVVGYINIKTNKKEREGKIITFKNLNIEILNKLQFTTL